MKLRSIAFACLAAALVSAQTPSASVTGRITDSTGAAMPGVAVVITNIDTN
jgi:hypothetical protein